MSAAAAATMAALVLLTPVSAVAPGPHIADLHVLLPPRMTNPVGYRLQGSGGCFSWSWDHHEILLVEPESNISQHCSTSAWLTSIAPYRGRKETSVYATDRVSGTTLHCKVFIDKISQIQIFHHAVKINLDELATLHVRAFDNEENVFSSLVGLQFSWKLEPRSSVAGSVSHLVHVPLKETPLSDCSGFCGDLDARTELEDKGLGADLFVVKGVNIGHEMVTAELFEADYEHMADKIMLTVAEAMSLDPPSPVLVTVGSLIIYRLRVLRQNALHAISLPSKYHNWHVTNSSVAQVDSHLGIAQALNLGLSEIVVEDIRVPGHVQTSSIYVVIPYKLTLHLIPFVNGTLINGNTQTSSAAWHVFPGQDYILLAQAFAEGFNNSELYLTEKNEVRVEKNTTHWELLSLPGGFREPYGLQYSSLLRPLSEGNGALVASLSYQRGVVEAPEMLELVQELTVCKRVKLSLDEDMKYSGAIHLPWIEGVSQELKLEATGGCVDHYKYISSDDGVISVSESGIVHARRPGISIVRVFSELDFMNYDEVAVEVSIPSTLVILPTFPVDMVVGTEYLAMAKLKTSNGNYFSRCDFFRSFIQWNVLSESKSFEVFDLLNKSKLAEHLEDWGKLYEQSCSMTVLKASSGGLATLMVSLSYPLPSHMELGGAALLKTSLKISAYHPLVVFQAADGNQYGGYWVNVTKFNFGDLNMENKALTELYIAPGSTMDVFIYGGPDHWDSNVEFTEDVSVSGYISSSPFDTIVVQPLSYRLYRVACNRKGIFKLRFSRGNLASVDHPSTIASVELPVTCDIPSAITLVANEPVNAIEILEASRKAARASDVPRRPPVVISNGKRIRLAAVGVHKTNNYFANTSSLCLRWELSNCQYIASWNGIDDTKANGRSTWEKFLVILNMTGLCTVRATLIGFCEPYNDAYHSLQHKEQNTTDSIQLQIVSSLIVDPEFVLLVYHSQAKENLFVAGGTCFLDAYSNCTHVVEILEYPGKNQCSKLVVGVRGLGSALVTIRDIGLSPATSVASLVKVANVDWIKIVSEEHISLMEGTTKEFELKAGTKDGDIFGDSQYQYMDIEVHLDDKILEQIDAKNYSIISGRSLRAPQLLIRAKKLGVTSLYVIGKQHSGQRITSQLIKVEVYKPLQVHPEYIFLAPRTSYMLAVRGGPKIGSITKFSSTHGSAEIDSKSGKLSAISLGNSTIRAAVYGHGGSFICEAFGVVEVGIPETMALVSQSDELCVGCSMPVYLLSSKGEPFSFYEVCQDYRWTITNKMVLEFLPDESLHYSVDKQSSYGGKDLLWFSKSGNSSFITTVTGRSSGKTEVSVVITCDMMSLNGFHPSVYYASIAITVVPDPPIALGIPVTWILPPSYTTSDLLPQFYREMGSHDLVYSVSYSLLELSGSNGLLKSNGIAILGSKIRTGESYDLVCIQANDQATGRAEVASCVRVTEVEQVRIAASESSCHVAYLGVNSRLELNVKYGDRLGYTFTEAFGVVPLEVDTNHPDVVSALVPKDDNITVCNDRIILEARSPGTALVKIYMNHNPKKADYILVSVGAQMYPSEPIIHVGNCLNFSIVGHGNIGLKSGHWASGNKTVLSVNRITGEACGQGEGVVEVIFRVSNLKLRTTVNVIEASQINLAIPPKISNNIQLEVPITSKDAGAPLASDERSTNGSNGAGGSLTPTRTSLALWPAILVTAAVLVLTILAFLRLLDRPTASATTRTAAPAASAVPAQTATPDRHSGSAESIPRTPEPFIEYVRKTLDETPYYKREPRRRHDPQYTY